MVTDIASFRALTGRGSIGQLWPCDEPAALRAALTAGAARVDQSARAQVRAHFERELSFAALGAKLGAMYADLRHTEAASLRRAGP